MALDEVCPDLLAELDAAGVSLSRGNRAYEETGEKHQFGIPCSGLPGLQPMLMNESSDMYLCIFTVTGNDDNVIKFFEQFPRKDVTPHDEHRRAVRHQSCVHPYAAAL